MPRVGLVGGVNDQDGGIDQDALVGGSRGRLSAHQRHGFALEPGGGVPCLTDNERPAWMGG